ncbi:PP2C family protein-serine/threonine phosphatase [Sinosporangium siamense]|nr:PP2C family protein-serine/threonine phosphatase [Sinosporangium siamense]
MTHDRLKLDDVLAAAERAAPVESIDVVAANLQERFGAVAVSFLFVDMVGRLVVRINEETASQQDRGAEQISLIGSVYEQVLRTQQPTHVPDEEYGQRVIAPVTNRGDTIGLLELTLPRITEDVLEQIGQAAHALAYIIVTDRRFTDLYLWSQRTTRVSLAAEIQHQLLPSATCCEAAQFVLAAGMVSADTIGGDTYDYTLDYGTLHLSITDAMGHDVGSALLATLLVNASRGARRAGCDLAEQARRTHRALLDHGQGGLATGQLLRIALDGSKMQLVNAGHPWPLRLRDGEVEEVPLDIDPPFGFPFTVDHRVQNLDLRPGDRLVLYTDGMRERQAEKVDLIALIRDTNAQHPREVVRTLTGAVTDACQGHLADDAGILCLDWHGPSRDGYRTYPADK